jgi:hypothetical protein
MGLLGLDNSAQRFSSQQRHIRVSHQYQINLSTQVRLSLLHSMACAQLRLLNNESRLALQNLPNGL